jgi:hypothetical protein
MTPDELRKLLQSEDERTEWKQGIHPSRSM